MLGKPAAMCERVKSDHFLTPCAQSLSHVRLWDPLDCSPPGCFVHGILQARILQWVAISSSRGSSQPRDQTQVFHTAGGFFTIWATMQALHTKINSKWIKDLNVRPETIKLLEKNTGRTLDDIYQSKILYDSPPRVMEIKAKINKWDLMKLKSFLHSKGNYKQGEKTTLRMGENNSKGNNWQIINFQNIQAAHTTQYQKN